MTTYWSHPPVGPTTVTVSRAIEKQPSHSRKEQRSSHDQVRASAHIPDNHHWHAIALGSNDQMSMNASTSPEMRTQCGPSHAKRGRNVDPPHLHNPNADAMRNNVDALRSNADPHTPNANKCTHTACQNNGDPRPLPGKYELYVDHHTPNVDPPHLHISTMRTHHTSTSPQCGASTPTHLTTRLAPSLQSIPCRPGFRFTY